MATSIRDVNKPSFNPEAQSLRIGIVVSEWNNNITENLFQGAKESLIAQGVRTENIYRSNVPGSFELIYGCKVMTKKSLDVVIAIGSVIRGETAHFDYVCQAVSSGIKELNLLGVAPVIFGVLTDDTLEQAQSRSGGALGNKGAEAAAAAIEMATLSI